MSRAKKPEGPCVLVPLSEDDGAVEAIEAVTTRDPYAVMDDAEWLFKLSGIHADAHENQFEACVAPSGKVLGVSALGFYTSAPDEADPLARPRYTLSIAVAEDARRQGIARRLVQSAIRAYPRDQVLLEGKVVNPHMAKLLKDEGFVYAEPERHEGEPWSDLDLQIGRRMYRPNPGQHRLRFASEADLVAAYRARHPHSRSPRIVRYVVNTSRRRQKGCILCGETGPSWSGSYPKTRQAERWEEEHTAMHVRREQERLDREHATWIADVRRRRDARESHRKSLAGAARFRGLELGPHSRQAGDVSGGAERFRGLELESAPPGQAEWAGGAERFRGLELNPRRERDDHRYRFVCSCLDSTFEDIQALKASAQKIERHAFVRKLAEGEWALIRKSLGYETLGEIQKDKLIGYYRSTFRGVPAVFLAWSGIEYVFTLDGKIGTSAARDARWNPDDRLRDLERAAAQGDPAAARALRREQARVGAHVPADVLIADAILDGDPARARTLRYDLQVRFAGGDAAAGRALRRVLAHEQRGLLPTDQCHQLLADAIEEGEFVRIPSLAVAAARARLGGMGTALGCPYDPGDLIYLFQYPGPLGRCRSDPTFDSQLRRFSPGPTRATSGVLAGRVEGYGYLVHVEDGASREVRDRLHDLTTNVVYLVLGVPRPWAPGDVEAALLLGRGFDPALDEERFRRDWARLAALPAKRIGGQNPPDDELRRLERLASQGDRDAHLALHAARRRASVPETGEQALEYLIATTQPARVSSDVAGNSQQLAARLGCPYVGDGAGTVGVGPNDGVWWNRGHPDAARVEPGVWVHWYRDWLVLVDEGARPEIRAALAALPTPAAALVRQVASFPGRLPSLERARRLANDLRAAHLRHLGFRSLGGLTPSEEAEFVAEWRRWVREA